MYQAIYKYTLMTGGMKQCNMCVFFCRFFVLGLLVIFNWTMFFFRILEWFLILKWCLFFSYPLFKNPWFLHLSPKTCRHVASFHGTHGRLWRLDGICRASSDLCPGWIWRRAVGLGQKSSRDLGGGNSNMYHVFFSPRIPGEMFQFDGCIFFKWVGSTTR